jgi:hypothetical protein
MCSAVFYGMPTADGERSNAPSSPVLPSPQAFSLPFPDHGWFLLSCFRPISGLFFSSVTAFIREFPREFRSGSDQGGSFPVRKRNTGVYTLERSRTARGVPRFSRDFRENLHRWTRMPERISRACRHRVSLQGGPECCPCSRFRERVANKRVNSPGRNRPGRECECPAARHGFRGSRVPFHSSGEAQAVLSVRG